MAGVDPVLAGITVTASLLSLIGTAFILTSYLILPHKKHIRHALIVNLTLADLINATNNSISGLWVLTNNKSLTDSPKCVANGFVGQLSVQAVDCSILAITIVTFWIVTSRTVIADISIWKIILICASAWVLPIITSFIALFNGWYHPVSGNWCWIQESPPYLRYVLTHGWRFVIIFIVSGLCIYIQIYLRRHLRFSASAAQSSQGRSSYVRFSRPSMPSVETLAKKKVQVNEDEEAIIGRGSNLDAFGESEVCVLHDHPTPKMPFTPPSPQEPKPPTRTPLTKRIMRIFSSKRITASKQQKNSIEKTMLLNAYPVFYIILWIPGIANRIAEATGHKVYTLEVLQASTQLIGFANAITFGWNEKVGKNLAARLRDVFRGRGMKRWVID